MPYIVPPIEYTPVGVFRSPSTLRSANPADPMRACMAGNAGTHRSPDLVKVARRAVLLEKLSVVTSTSCRVPEGSVRSRLASSAGVLVAGCVAACVRSPAEADPELEADVPGADPPLAPGVPASPPGPVAVGPAAPVAAASADDPGPVPRVLAQTAAPRTITRTPDSRATPSVCRPRAVTSPPYRV
ncbi:hypothetical protein Voc01_039000 [Virgisporangium ochraceum]|uniref:Uncharacterized protein n=1 Tax=Virgisporangium ochraceum TaxID=65505 RepID=A0A8J4EBZ6_9ACTN|nr:hypothetical protein Voc01_039000 [Virgisporangium ochraceum]